MVGKYGPLPNYSRRWCYCSKLKFRSALLFWFGWFFLQVFLIAFVFSLLVFSMGSMICTWGKGFIRTLAGRDFTCIRLPEFKKGVTCSMLGLVSFHERWSPRDLMILQFSASNFLIVLKYGDVRPPPEITFDDKLGVRNNYLYLIIFAPRLELVWYQALGNKT